VCPVLCEYYDSYDNDTCNCPYRAYVDATCASVKKKINELTDKMIENMKVRIAEYSQCFNQRRRILLSLTLVLDLLNLKLVSMRILSPLISRNPI